MVHAPTRLKPSAGCAGALGGLTIEGFPTNAGLSHLILCHPDYVRGVCTTAFLENHLQELLDWDRLAAESEATQ